MVMGALALFAVGAGLLLARTAGERGVGDELSGAIEALDQDPSHALPGARLHRWRPARRLECFDDVLLDDPENAEALAYRGWYLLLAAGSLQEGTDTGGTGAIDAADIEELTATGLEYLNRAVEADPLLPDPLAFRATIHDRQGRSAEACRDVAALVALDPPPSS